ncbi:MAG: hypothetical protein Q8S29_04120 [Phreatobacter sp.]|nr:hypothetical protein [Phreatobacter sp.]
MPVVIEPVNTKAALKEFIRLPGRLYRDFPAYVPPLTMDRKGFLDPAKAPLYKHGKAQYWIARRDGRAVGRISAQIDEAQPATTFGDAGLFGCLDAIDDPKVVEVLLAAAVDWLRAQGRTRAVGPCLLSMNEEPGLLVEGHDEPPLIMVPWHPPYLARHLEACGFVPCRDLHYWRLEHIEDHLRTLNERRRAMTAAAITIRPLNMRDIPGDIEIMRLVYNDAWKDNWGFVPLEPEDLAGLSRDMKPFVRPELGMIVERAGKTVAVAMILPNLFEITADLGADPSVLGWAKLGYRTFFHKFSTGRIILLGVLSEFRQSVTGAMIAMAMVDEIITRFTNYNNDLKWVEAGWVLDNNEPLRKLLRQFGFSIVRTMRLYDRELGVA